RLLEDDDGRADVEVGGRYLAPRQGHEAGGHGLALQLGGGKGADADLVFLLAQLAGRGDGLPQALDHDLLADVDRVQRQAGVDPAVDLAHVRQRGWAFALPWRRLDDRQGGPAAGQQVGGDAAEALDPGGAVRQQLRQLHRGQG